MAPILPIDVPVTGHQSNRLAIGVFNNAGELQKAIDQLSNIQLPPSELVIVAERGAIHGQLERLPVAGETAAGLQPSLLVRDSGKVVAHIHDATRSGVLAYLNEEQLSHFETWTTPALSDDLNAHLQSGACVLVVPITSAKNERLISEVLLQGSAAKVQLHDVTSGPSQ